MMVINYETGKEQNVFPVHMSSILLGAVVGTGSLWPYVSSCFIHYQRQTEWNSGCMDRTLFFSLGSCSPVSPWPYVSSCFIQYQRQTEWTSTHGCMDRTLFFSLGSCSPTNLCVTEGSKSVPGVLKLRFIQLNGLRPAKQGWCISGCGLQQPLKAMSKPVSRSNS
jgi:hypothetical protein